MEQSTKGEGTTLFTSTDKSQRKATRGFRFGCVCLKEAGYGKVRVPLDFSVT